MYVIQLIYCTDSITFDFLADVLGRLLSWHWIAVVAFGTALFQAIAIPFCPPSPRYLLIFAGQEGKAREGNDANLCIKFSAYSGR